MATGVSPVPNEKSWELVAWLLEMPGGWMVLV